MRNPLRIKALEELTADRNWERAFSTAGVVVVIPFACALFGAYTSEFQKDFGTRATVGLWALALALFAILAVRVNPFGKTLVALAAENERLEDFIADQAKEGVADHKSIDLLAFQASYANSARSIILNHALRNIATLEGLREALGDLTVPLSYSGGLLFGLVADEKWSFAIYLYSRKRDLLIPVWRDRSRNHPSQGTMGRSWGRGEGHVGKAFVDQKPIITRDTLSPEAAQFSTVPQGRDKPYDSAYVSFASIPIGPIIAMDDRPYGILVGTSDYVGRFDRDSAGIMVQIAGAVASLLIAGKLDVDKMTPAKRGRVAYRGGRGRWQRRRSISTRASHRRMSWLKPIR